jgi:hypothetical protein
MKRFDALLARGFGAMTAAIGVDLVFGTLTAKCIPASQPLRRDLRDSGPWTSGMQTVELKRSDFTRLGIEMKGVVRIAGKPMKVTVIDSDEADPCVRLTLIPMSTQT